MTENPHETFDEKNIPLKAASPDTWDEALVGISCA